MRIVKIGIAFIIVILFLVSNNTFSQQKIIEINPVTNQLKTGQSLPFDEEFLLKVILDKSDRIEQIIISEINRHGDFKTITLREWRMLRDHSLDHDLNFPKITNGVELKTTSWLRNYFSSTANFKLIEVGTGSDFYNLGLRYQLSPKDIIYNPKFDDGKLINTEAYITVPPLDPNTTHHIFYEYRITEDEHLQLYKEINKLIDPNFDVISPFESAYIDAQNEVDTLLNNIKFKPFPIDTSLIFAAIDSLSKAYKEYKKSFVRTDSQAIKSSPVLTPIRVGESKNKSLVLSDINNVFAPFDSLYNLRREITKVNRDSVELWKLQFSNLITDYAHEIYFKDDPRNGTTITPTDFGINTLKTTSSIEAQSLTVIQPEFGVVLLGNFGPTRTRYIATAGIHITFRPINSNAPLPKIKYSNWKQWFSIYLGISVDALSNYKVENQTTDLVGNISIATGIGIRFSRVSRFNGGLLWIRKNDTNPVVNDYSTAFVPYFGVTVDTKIQQLLPSIINLFK